MRLIPVGALMDAPIDPNEFSRTMDGFAPFEPEPVIAVGVSGGPDSMALLILLDEWALRRGGSVLAMTVDHGLRPDSAAEASQVAIWAADRGIAHVTLIWAGAKPTAGIQAAARVARYDLLADACASRGILNLALAHHANDQAETVLFRQDRGSGPAGLAGMASSRSLGAVRLIRPLLAVPKTALTATCRQVAQAYIEDPSNSADRYARTALRRRLAADTDLQGAMIETAADAAARRLHHNHDLSQNLGRLAAISPLGFVTIDRAGLADLSADPRRKILSAALRTVGGRLFAPDAESVARLDVALADDASAGYSLAGCVVRVRRGQLLICREPGRAASPTVLTPHTWHRWDGRFALRVAGGCGDGTLTLGALGARAYSILRRSYRSELSAIVGAGLPALRLDDRLIAVPAVGWAEKGIPGVEQRFLPPWPLSSETFTVVSTQSDIMSV